MRQPRVHLGLGGSVAAVTRSLFRTLDAGVVHFVLQDRQTKNTYRWRVDRAAADDRTELPRVEVDVGEQDDWLFTDVGRVWEGVRTSNEASALRARVVDVGTWPLRRTTVQLPEGFAERHEFTRVVVANLGLADEWVGRIYVFDPSFTMNVEQALHFVDTLVEHVTPALSNVFLVGRLRTRATESERARVARELHDGAIQALFGVEMKVHALRRRADTDPAATEAELGEIQELLRREVLALRELMQALRPIELDSSNELPAVLASLVERFRRDTGVSARFLFTGLPIALAPATALEIVRIAQEALVNVRKHSRARNVLVRLTGSDRACTLVVEDDGVGFEFDGTMSADELDERRMGPAIIKERARIAGAALIIESTRDVGARIQISVEATR